MTVSENSHRVTFEAWIKYMRINAFSTKADTFKPTLDELLAQLRTCGEKKIRSVMMQAKHVSSETLQNAHSVVLCVNGNVSMIARFSKVRTKGVQKGEYE